MWIIASIPFWVIGVLFSLGAFINGRRAFVNGIAGDLTPDEGRRLGFAAIALLLAGLFFLIAAKVAS